MVFVQLLVTNLTSGSLTANNNSYLDVPLYGVYDINIISVQFHATGAATEWRVLELQSDVLRFPHSNRQYLTFLNNGQNYINFEASGELMPSIKNIDFNGKILCNVNLLAGTALPSPSFHCIVTLEATVCTNAK
jgi:hypothetical protein